MQPSRWSTLETDIYCLLIFFFTPVESKFHLKNAPGIDRRPGWKLARAEAPGVQAGRVVAACPKAMVSRPIQPSRPASSWPTTHLPTRPPQLHLPFLQLSSHCREAQGREWVRVRVGRRCVVQVLRARAAAGREEPVLRRIGRGSAQRARPSARAGLSSNRHLLT